MGRFFELGGQLLFRLWAQAADKVPPEIVKAPDKLDFNQLLKWLHGSIWALLGLNLLALLFFFTTLLWPQLSKLANFIRQILVESAAKRAQAAAQVKAQPAEAPVEAAPAAATPAEPAAAPASTEPSGLEDKTEMITPEDAPEVFPEAGEKTEVIEPAPPEVVVQTKAPQQTLSDDTQNLPAPEEITQILEKEVQATTPSEPVARTEPMPDAPTAQPSPSSLSEVEVSGETQMGESPKTTEPKPGMSAFGKSLDSTFNAASNLERTEELPIFDPSMIDEALEMDEATEVDRKTRPKT